MTDRRGERRPPRRRGVLRRDPVPALPPDSDPDDPDEGSAGVREPRRPLPLPMSGAGTAPVPTPALVAVLPDPRS